MPMPTGLPVPQPTAGAPAQPAWLLIRKSLDGRLQSKAEFTSRP